MTLLDQINWCETPLVSPTPDTPTEREIKAYLGTSFTILSYLAPVPWLAWSFAAKIPPVAHISSRMADLITLVVSMENSCRHCYGATRSMLKLTGFSEREISQLEEDLYRSNLDEREKAILTFSRKCAQSDPRPDATDLAELRQLGLNRESIAEVAFVATNTCFSNRLATILAIPPDVAENIERHPVSRLLRPLANVFFRNFMHKATRKNIEKFQSESDLYKNNGFGTKLVEALRGSPTAFVLERTLYEAWESPVTTKQTKALAFAIIAQALNCSYCTEEACQLLKNEGLVQTEIDHLLTYLNLDVLNEFESKFIHFARDTVSYQVPDIQFIARDFTAELSNTEIIEVIGLVGLANWVARLSVLLYQMEEV